MRKRKAGCRMSCTNGKKGPTKRAKRDTLETSHKAHHLRQGLPGGERANSPYVKAFQWSKRAIGENTPDVASQRTNGETRIRHTHADTNDEGGSGEGGDQVLRHLGWKA